MKALLQAVWHEWNKRQTDDASPAIALLAEVTHLECQLLVQSNQDADMLLLQTQPTELAVKYQEMIEFVVKKKLQEPNDRKINFPMDIIANIQEHVLSKLASGKISKQYKGKALFSTYLYRVANYALIDELRKRKSRIETIPIESLSSKSSLTAPKEFYNEALEEYLENFRILLGMMFERERKRFEFTLQVIYYLPMKAKVVQSLYPNCPGILLVEILSVFGGEVKDRGLSLTEIYQSLSLFITQLEKKKKPILTESLRAWFQKRLNQVKKTLFEGLSFDSKSDMDRYFEVLVYKFYKQL
ncbi:MAG: hypothetical protein AB8B69_19480 [Chitinophagales bacterium]